MALTKPTQITVPFASSGLKNTIPETATGSNRASMQEGFPAITMQDVDLGGMAPYGQDMNGIIYDVTKAIQYQQAGGFFPYDATFAAAIDGYPIGAIVTSADGTQLFQNTLDGNQSDPENGGANWSNIMTSASLAGKQDKLNQTQMDAVNSGITSAKVAIYDSYASTKQNTLTFDNTPTNGSSNPVTSDGIYAALGTKQDIITVDASPTDGSTNPVQSGGVYTALAGKVDISNANSAEVTATGSTTARTLANRFADVINIKDFGAKGDGTTDDRTAINNALAYASASGKTLLLDGTFLTSSGMIEIPSGTHMVGSPGTEIIRGYNTADGHAALATFIPKTGESTVHDITIEGIVFDGNGDTFGTVSFDILVWAGYPTYNIVIRDCEFLDIIDYHAIDVDWTDGLLVENCKFKGWKNVYETGDVATRREMIQLQGTITNTFQNKNIIIKNCWFGASDTTGFGAPPVGIGNHGWFDSSDVIRYIMIVNNTFEGCAYYGVTVFGWQNVLIDGNNFLGCNALGLICRIASSAVNDTTHDAVVKDIKFTNNTCRRNSTTGVAIQAWIAGGYASVASRYTDITDIFPSSIFIYGNTIENYNAIVFIVGKDVKILNNVFSQLAVSFFRVNNVEISGNVLNNAYIWNAATSGYFTATDYPATDDCNRNASIKNNFFRELRGNTIYIGVARENIEITGNIVFNKDVSTGSNAPCVLASGCKYVDVCDNIFVNLKNIRQAFISLTQDSTYQVYGNRYYKQGVAVDPYYGSTVTESYVPSAGGTVTGAILPSPDNSVGLGSSSYRWSTVYAGTSSINTSDAREKDNLNSIPDDVLDAWGDVPIKVFQFKDALEKKSDSARIHTGVIAQQVKEVFESRGLDASRYGLFCHDEWEDEYEDVEVVDQDAVIDKYGNEVTPAVTHTEHRLVQAAGDRYGIRYEEALVLEAAYQRRRADRIEARLQAIEERLA